MIIKNLHKIKENNNKIYNFADVIESIDGFKVIKFNNPGLLTKLKLAAEKTLNKNNSQPSKYEGRINEFGNYIQKVFAEECQILGINYYTPQDIKGKKKETGYPDGCIEIKNGTFCYIEVKTFAEKNRDSTLRSFFYSPSVNSKITRDASHLLIGFSTQSLSAKGPHIITGYHFIDLFTKKVKLKLEFNQNNLIMYKETELL